MFWIISHNQITTTIISLRVHTSCYEALVFFKNSLDCKNGTKQREYSCDVKKHSNPSFYVEKGHKVRLVILEGLRCC